MSTEEINFINIENTDYNSEYLRTNLGFNLEKVKEIDCLLRKASKGIFIPVKRIFDFYSNHLILFKRKLIALKKEADKNIIEGKEVSPNSISSSSSCYTSKLSNDENEILKNLLSSVMNVVGQFNNLFNTPQFEELVKSIPKEVKNIKKEILSDDETCFKEGMDKDTKKLKHKFIGKKKKRSPSEERQNEKNSKQKKKIVTENEEKAVKKISDEEATELMRQHFKDQFSGITKTFLTRKLVKTVIWSGEFDFKEKDPWTNQREIVKSATYKFSKVTMDLSETPLDILDLVKKGYKRYICKLCEEKVIIGGEMNEELEEFLEIFKDPNNIEKFKIINLKIEIYAFLEEVCQLFEQDSDKNINNFSEQELASINSQWNIIKEMREMWRSLKGVK